MATAPHEVEFQEGERIYLGKTQRARIADHLARYEFALTHVRDDSVVLDAASGSGYGTEILSRKAGRVVGLEISEHALAYAEAHHRNQRIEYRRADLNDTLDLPSESFDVVVCFETLEHVLLQHHLLAEFHRVLKPSGTLVISTPDRWVFSWLDGYRNRFHVHELTKVEFLKGLGQGFEVSALYGQTLWRGSRVRAIARGCLRKSLPLVVRRAVRSVVPRARSSSNGVEMQPDPAEYLIEPIQFRGRSKHYYQIAVAIRR